MNTRQTFALVLVLSATPACAHPIEQQPAQKKKGVIAPVPPEKSLVILPIVPLNNNIEVVVLAKKIPARSHAITYVVEIPTMRRQPIWRMFRLSMEPY